MIKALEQIMKKGEGKGDFGYYDSFAEGLRELVYSGIPKKEIIKSLSDDQFTPWLTYSLCLQERNLKKSPNLLNLTSFEKVIYDSLANIASTTKAYQKVMKRLIKENPLYAKIFKSYTRKGVPEELRQAYHNGLRAQSNAEKQLGCLSVLTSLFAIGLADNLPVATVVLLINTGLIIGALIESYRITKADTLFREWYLS